MGRQDTKGLDEEMWLGMCTGVEGGRGRAKQAGGRAGGSQVGSNKPRLTRLQRRMAYEYFTRFLWPHLVPSCRP